MWQPGHLRLLTSTAFLITLKNGAGEVTEVVPYNVGFRRFEIKENGEKSEKGMPYVCFFVNGQPIKLKGVNIHEHNPRPATT